MPIHLRYQLTKCLMFDPLIGRDSRRMPPFRKRGDSEEGSMPPFRKRGDSEEGSTESTPRAGVTPGGAKRRRRDGTDIGGHRRCVFKLTTEENVGFMDRIRVSSLC